MLLPQAEQKKYPNAALAEWLGFSEDKFSIAKNYYLVQSIMFVPLTARPFSIGLATKT
jgi:hypothetical protein